jgi:hypothetical protein
MRDPMDDPLIDPADDPLIDPADEPLIDPADEPVDGPGPADEPVDGPGPAPDDVPDGAGAAEPAARRRVRMATVVLGLVLAVVAGTVWRAGVLELDVSFGGVATVAMIGAGLLLLAGAFTRDPARTAGVRP